MIRNRIIILFCAALILLIPAALRAEEPKDEDNGVAGEIFGTPVSLGNYYFAKRTLLVFGTKFGPEPKTAQEIETSVWEHLILSFEAFRRGIEVSEQEVDDEITKTLNAEKVTFDWKTDKDAYEKWLKEKIRENSDMFRNQLRYLMQLQKLRQQVIDNTEVTVTEQEAFQTYLDEYNTLETELAQFESLKDAQDFYKKVKSSPKFWEAQTKDNPKLFRRPGFVALEFLMDMWKYPKDDLYKMLEVKIGTIYPPIPIYGGKYGIVKVLKVRRADKSKFGELRQSYFDRVKMRKKYEGFDAWFKKFKQDANIKVFIQQKEEPKGASTTTEKK